MKPLKELLIVNDDPDILTILQYCFKKMPNVKLRCVRSGEEALKAALQQVPDMILLDVMMPEMDGVATLKALRLIPCLEKVPVIFLTARSQKKETEEYLRHGCYEVIPKPFDSLTIAQTILDIWEKTQNNSTRS